MITTFPISKQPWCIYVYVGVRASQKGRKPSKSSVWRLFFFFRFMVCMNQKKCGNNSFYLKSDCNTKHALNKKKLLNKSSFPGSALPESFFIEVPQLGIPFWNASSHLCGELFETPEWKNICLTYFKWLCLDESLPDLALSGQGKHVQNILLHQGFSCI